MGMSHNESHLQARFRSRVEAELAALQTESGDSAENRAPVVLDQQSVGRLSRMDAMQVQEMAQATERRRQARIVGLEAALLRMDDGSFGECHNCAEPIPEARLDFDPTIRLCVACAQGDQR